MRHTTLAMLALAAMPAVALAQDSTSGGQRQVAPQTPADSTRAMQAQTQGATSEAKPAKVGAGQTETAQGRRTSGRRTMPLSRENVVQLQTALTNAGCDAGTADGVMGPRTRRAMACARQKNSVSSNEELYRSLNLDFAGEASAGAPPSGMQHADSARMNAPMGAPGRMDSMPRQDTTAAPGVAPTRGDSAQVGGGNMGRVRPPADSARKPTIPPQRD